MRAGDVKQDDASLDIDLDVAGEPGQVSPYAVDIDLGEASVLDVGRGLLAFNWLPAAYSHRDWLGPWNEILEPRRAASLRLIRRASIVLLDRYDLRQRYLRDLGRHGWLLQPQTIIKRMADTLGTAMLGSWVQKRLERREVALQIKVLGSERRDLALEYSRSLRALPFPDGGAWPISLTGSGTLFRLGVSCMAALLDDPYSGARERFTLRFSHGLLSPVRLSVAQQDEALALLHGVLDEPLEQP
jgi:YOP proteins translocation protein K (YscK)